MIESVGQQITLRCGAKLGFAEFGDPLGAPIFYCHGFPASRLEGELYNTSAIRNKFRLIVMDRPGYGLSDPLPMKTISDWPDQLAFLADHLGIDRFSVLGVSGGGPYALSCAYRIPHRVLSAGIVCGLGPIYQNWAPVKMKWPARLGFYLAKKAPSLLPVFFGDLTAMLMRWRPAICQALLTISAPDSDVAVLKEKKVIDLIFASLTEALRNGASGSLADFFLYAHDWGFDPSQIDCPISLWHGRADTVVPIEHAFYFEKTLGNSSSTYFDEEGHFSLPIRHMDEILGQLKVLSLN